MGPGSTQLKAIAWNVFQALGCQRHVGAIKKLAQQARRTTRLRNDVAHIGNDKVLGM